MNSLDTNSLLYNAAAESTIHYRTVPHALFQAFFDSVVALKRSAKDQHLDERWQRLLRAMTRFRYEASHVPLPFNHEFLWSRIDLGYLHETVRLGRISRPSLAASATSALELLMKLRTCIDDPLRPTIVEFLPTGQLAERGAILISESRFAFPVLEAYPSHDGARIDVITEDALRFPIVYDQIIAIGDTREFSDYVFSSPRSVSLEVVGYSWQTGRWQSSPSFHGSIGNQGRRHQQSWASTAPGNDQLEEVDVDELTRFLLANEPPEVGGSISFDQTDARLYALYGGKGVFLEVSDRKTVMVLDLEIEATDRVIMADENVLEPGTYVILRTDSREGYLVPVADNIMGTSARLYRRKLFNWKVILKERVASVGFDEAVSALGIHGSKIANTQNVRNWMSSRTIAPRDYSDFLAMMKYCALEREAEELFKMASTVRRAHMRAGQLIQRRLRALIAESDIGEIELEGIRAFELPDLEGVCLTAFRVEKRSPRITAVPAASMERVFDLQQV